MKPGGSLWLRWLGAERGVLLWLPGLWLVAALVLFAIVQASEERTFYNHTRDLRMALGPLDLAAVGAGDGVAFTAALRQGLAAERELTLVADDVVRGRVRQLLGAPLPEDPRRWMRATRSLNLSVYLTARLLQDGEELHASARLWSVGDEAEIARFSTRQGSAASLGRALADSVSSALFSPQAAPAPSP
jgi:hypothetical protein